MKSEYLVEVDNISKKFCRDLRTSLKYAIRDISREIAGKPMGTELREKEFWAVRNVSFVVKRGEALGIIGPNGAGKSTILKMLNGIFKPNSGFIRMRGRVQALIELGAGFNPILTGRENIFINGAILGISSSEIKKQLESIIDFAELSDFIDTPVVSYSSGMKVRLGFAIAIHMKPDVLIIDEVLSVGDHRFRRKARNAMAEMLNLDVALIFVSHNIHEVLGITNKALLLDKGETKIYDKTPVVCSKYLSKSFSPNQLDKSCEFDYMNKRTGELYITQVELHKDNGIFSNSITVNREDATFKIKINYQALTDINEPVFHIFNLGTIFGDKVGYNIIKDHCKIKNNSTMERSYIFNLKDYHPGGYKIAYELGTEGGPRLEGINNLFHFNVVASQSLISKENNPQDGDTYFARMLDNDRGSSILSVKMEK
ncbi:MAG: ATP-binding cassette domain-containing protein [Candidatus Marinimicrobia bacterium]|nr:ATP-binding cassette domain-containing protein [Candidatus Neomarinimicrobiota bacterium]